MGQCSFLLTVLAFRCPLSVYSQIDIGCGIKIVAVFVSAKNTLSRHQPTNPDPESVSTTCPKQTATCTKCKQPKQSVHADRSQEIQQPQTNANKTFSSQRLECLATSLLHHGPENRTQKTSRNMAAIKGPRLYLLFAFTDGAYEPTSATPATIGGLLVDAVFGIFRATNSRARVVAGARCHKTMGHASLAQPRRVLFRQQCSEYCLSASRRSHACSKGNSN